MTDRERRIPLLGISVIILVLSIAVVAQGHLQETQLVTPVLTIPNETAPSAYLLVRPDPEGVSVDAEGRIYVADEDRVKVYGPAGEALRILGGPGQGPGEFDNCRWLTVSENGYVTVRSGNVLHTVHVFSPQLEFLQRFNYRNERPYAQEVVALGASPQRPTTVYSYGPDERVYLLTALERAQGGGPISRHWEILVHEVGESVEFLREYESTRSIQTGREHMQLRFNFFGALHVGFLDGKRLVYIHTGHDVQHSGGEHSYTLTIRSLDDGLERRIRHTFTPVPIDNEELSRWRATFSVIPRSDTRSWQLAEALLKAVDERVADQRFKAPLLGVRADGQYIFAFTYTRRDSAEVLTDVFDADGAAYLGSWYLPAYRDDGVSFSVIREGFAYELNDYRRDGAQEPHVRKLRIAPRVYRNTEPPR